MKLKTLAEIRPDLIKEWDFNKNGKITPYTVAGKCNKKVWWICNRGHQWDMVISSRTNANQNCPFCANKRACRDNCLASLHPELVKEWDMNKNNNLTPFNVLPNSHIKIWWICNNGHSWCSWLSDRVHHKTNCTQCLGSVIRDRKMINTTDGYRICKNCDKKLLPDDFRIKYDKRDHTKRIDNICKFCSSQMIKKYRKTMRGKAAEIVRRTKYFCKKNNLPFDLNKEWVFNKLEEIGWKCELTGLPMQIQAENGFDLHSISVDRLIPQKGYVKSNIRFVLNQINIFRQNGSDENMYMLAEALLNYKKNKG